MKNINHHITLKFISITLLGVILVMASVQIASMLKIKSDVTNIQTLWDKVKVEQSEKLRLENSIRVFLGFGGMIHKLKNVMLTNSFDQLESIKSDIQSIETIIQLYHSFPLTPAERYALDDIASVLNQYQNNIRQLNIHFQSASMPQRIDSFLQIDDNPALQGLEILRQYNRTLVMRNNGEDPPDKFMLLTDLVAQLGYGGLVDNIKDYELTRKSNNATKAQDNINQINILLKKYSALALTINEQNALTDLLITTDFYQQTLTSLQGPLHQREDKLLVSLQDIDNSTIQALQILEQHIEIALKDNIHNVGNNIHSIQTTINNLIQIIIFISVCAFLFFAYIMFHKVITPLQNVTQAMVMLARQRHNKEESFTANQVYEIKQMIRSIRIFRKNEGKRRDTAKSLFEVNEKTQQQLTEITKLQDKSEQKTEQALSLANHLIELQKRADIDRNIALDSQRKVNMILNTVHDAIITTDNKGLIESVNTTTELMLGYRESELVGKSIRDLMPDETAKMHKKIFQNLSSDRPPKIPKTSREQMLKRANGTMFPVDIFMGKSQFGNEITYTAAIRDITQRKKDEAEIQKLVLTDPLTNLANRRHFNQDLQRSMDNNKRLDLSVGLLMIDLDNFKPVNDTYGHNIGDKVLRTVADRLQSVTRNVDLIARLGGDEFAIILNSLSDCFDPLIPAQKVIDSIKQPMEIDGEVINIGATIGISVADKSTTVMEEFIDYADKALYKAKSLGKGQYFSYQDLAADER